MTIRTFGFVLLASCSAASASQPTLSDRVSAQRAIERVAWTHRTGARPDFEIVSSPSAVEARVRRSLSESVALERLWGEPLTATRLRRELDRMAKASRMP